VARTWLQIRVELLGGGSIECDPPPGRDFIVGPTRTFAQLAEAIDTAFARWDRAHLHGFELTDADASATPTPSTRPFCGPRSGCRDKCVGLKRPSDPGSDSDSEPGGIRSGSATCLRFLK
jgi:hypothetical protein